MFFRNASWATVVVVISVLAIMSPPTVSAGCKCGCGNEDCPGPSVCPNCIAARAEAESLRQQAAQHYAEASQHYAEAARLRAQASQPVVAGDAVAKTAASLARDYNNVRHVQYQDGEGASGGGNKSDCSHFVNDVLKQSGSSAGYVTTGDLYNGKNARNNYTETTTNPQAGDIMVQWKADNVTSDGGTYAGGHMGVYNGTQDRSGNPQGWEMGHSGVKLAPFGPNAPASWPFDGKGSPLKYFRPSN